MNFATVEIHIQGGVRRIWIWRNVSGTVCTSCTGNDRQQGKAETGKGTEAKEKRRRL